MTRFLTLDHSEKICFEYAKTYLAHDEPIPSFESRFPGTLERVLLAPQHTYGGKFLYDSLERQAAVLFYEMVKQHPFLNGNKRIATVALMAMLALNGKWLRADWKELYDVAVLIANSDQKHREGAIGLLEQFIKNKLVPL